MQSNLKPKLTLNANCPKWTVAFLQQCYSKWRPRKRLGVDVVNIVIFTLKNGEKIGINNNSFLFFIFWNEIRHRFFWKNTAYKLPICVEAEILLRVSSFTLNNRQFKNSTGSSPIGLGWDAVWVKRAGYIICWNDEWARRNGKWTGLREFQS